MSWATAAACSAALFSSDLPEAERVARLTRLFEPPVGAELRLDADELRDFSTKHKPTALRGFVRVKPPRGRCLTVQIREDVPDETICKEQTLSFRLGDLRHDGRLVWLVKTGEGDFGTPVSWPTPYRLVLSVPEGKAEEPPERRFLQGCEARRLDDGERRIVLRFVGGGHWTLKFPKEDTLVRNQPEPVPNLFVAETRSKAGIPGSKEAPAEGGQPASPAPAPAPAAAGEHGAAAQAAPQPPPRKLPVEDDEEEEKWHIPKRGTYEMSAANFMPFGSVTPGIKGKCRYSYAGDDVDPVTPRVECRGADGFEQVIIPVVCLQRP
jgi:hypothetical protein